MLRFIRSGGRTATDRAALKISESMRTALAEVARRHRIRLVVVFGSQVRGATHGGSDLDLGVLLNEPHNSGDPLALIADLQRLFTGQVVDVVWLHRADPLLAWEISQSAQLLYGDPQDMAQYCAYAWRRFVEYGKFFALEADAVQRGIARLRHAHR